MMTDGKVLDVAPHAELMARCTPYRELVEAQGQLGGGQLLEVA